MYLQGIKPDIFVIESWKWLGGENYLELWQFYTILELIYNCEKLFIKLHAWFVNKKDQGTT